MSVAFRRESDEEHREPKFERPIPPGPNLVTPRGLQLIADAVARLTAAVAAAGEEERPALEREGRYWRARQATATPAPPPVPGEIGIGSRVTIRLNGTQRAVEIVGTDEADPATERVGFQAPLARALLGAAEGDLLPFGGRDDAIAVLAVAP